MKKTTQLLVAALVFCAAGAWGQTVQKEPHIGYLYPGGGQRGETVKIIVGGQLLRSAKQIHISGEGVSAKIIQYFRPFRNLNGDQRYVLQKKFKELKDQRFLEETGKKPPEPKNKVKPRKLAANFRPVEHPVLYGLEDKSLRELDHVSYVMYFPRAKKQMNAQLDETTLIEVTIDPDAEPGDRELRVVTSTGLTNPMVFQVGQLPEVNELEPNDPKNYVNPKDPKYPPIELPVLLNGQIMPGDVDRFKIRAKKGQQLVMQVHARRLIPFLADAVPGWFQATLALYDAKGKEVAFADDYRFDPDPVMFYKIPADGVYELEIRDSIYRGREDFVYRIAVGEQPFITSAYPLGGRAGSKIMATIEGWNLAKKQMLLDTQPDGDIVRKTVLHQGKWVSNDVTYAVDTLSEHNEEEPNDTIENAEWISMPRIVNGRIGKPGDVDVYRLRGKAGDEVVAEIYSRRLNSPLDSLLRLTDESGKVIEWNDDNMIMDGHLHMDMGLITHHADSYIRAKLPKDGVYYVHVLDSSNHGSDAHAYRLRLTPPRPDFSLRMAPSSLTVFAGRSVPITIHALRKDGFDGPIALALKDAPAGFELAGARIPAGRNRVRLTLKAPAKSPGKPVVLQLEGYARVGAERIKRPVVPSEDMMQAFLWRHLAPSQEFLVSVRATKSKTPPVKRTDLTPVQIPMEGTTRVQLKAPKGFKLANIKLELNEPPKGVTLQKVDQIPGGLALVLKSDGKETEEGMADNLIVEAFTEYTSKNKNSKPQKRRVSVGVLPAIPFEIVKR